MEVKFIGNVSHYDEEKKEYVIDSAEYPLWDVVTTQCPFCLVWHENTMQYTDYVTHPMIWCDNCWARAVIDPLSVKFVHEQGNPVNHLTGDSRAYVCDLYKIIRISNCRSVALCYTEEDKTEEEREILLRRLFSEDIPYNRLKEFGLKRRGKGKKALDCVCENDGEPNHETLACSLGCSFPVNSYNTEEPEIPYPENFSLAHDGICIYLDCQDKQGKLHRVVYWGD